MNKSNIFFTSDSHFFHENFLRKYKVRSFDSVEDMNDTMIQKWNNIVAPRDIVYHLGDFSFGSGQETLELSKKLNGTIRYIRGNHERNLNYFKRRFEYVKDMDEIKIPYRGKGSYNGEISVVLSHYPMAAWNKSHHGSLNLFGHVHCRQYDTSQSVDVSVDSWDFYPITLQEAMERMKESPKLFTPNYD